MIDLAAELVAALRSDAGRAALADALRPVVAAAVREELSRAGDSLLDDRAAAEHVGLSVVAFRARVRRERDLAALALGGERFRRWRRCDLDGYMTARAGVRGRRGQPVSAFAPTMVCE